MWWKKQLNLKDKVGDLVGACYCIAQSDGAVDPEEIQVIAHAVLDLTADTTPLDELERMVHAARDQVDAQGVDKYMHSLGRGVDRGGREQILSGAAATVMADGELSPAETATYAQLAECLDISVEEAEHLLDEVIEARRNAKP